MLLRAARVAFEDARKFPYLRVLNFLSIFPVAAGAFGRCTRILDLLASAWLDGRSGRGGGITHCPQHRLDATVA
jgi:hypothetical protein